MMSTAVGITDNKGINTSLGSSQFSILNNIGAIQIVNSVNNQYLNPTPLILVYYFCLK